MLVWTLLAWSPPAGAQNHALLDQYGHTAWKSREGFLRGTPLQAIAQTSDGFLWLGTDNGLFRFDGLRYVPWQAPDGTQLPSAIIFSLLGTRDGALWIGTQQGLVRWKDGALTSYAELRGRRIGRLLEGRGGVVWTTIYVVPKWTLCAIQDGQARCYDGPGDPDYATGLYEDTRGTLWTGSQNRVWRWKPGPPEVIAIPGPTEGLLDFAEDDRGAVLFTAIGEIRRLVNNKSERAYLLPGSATNRPAHLHRDRDGGLWIGTSEGLVHIHEGRTDMFTPADGLSGVVLGFLEDREGTIWVATSGGLDRFRRLPVAKISRTQGLPLTPNTLLAATDGSVWFATEVGVYRLPALESTVARISADTLAARALFEDDRGRIWLAMRQQVGYLSEGRLVPVSGVSIGAVFVIAQDTQGAMWLKSVDGSLVRLSRDGAVRQIPGSAFGRKVIRSVRADARQGGLWLGFNDGGLAYFAGDQVKASYTSADGLPAAAVNDIALDNDGTVWAATEVGLSRLKDGRTATMTTRNGLPCANVHAILEDEARSFWLKMSCGVAGITRRQLDLWAADVDGHRDASRRIEALVLDNSDGVEMPAQAGGVRPIAAKSTDGRLWFKAEDGVDVVDPRRIPIDTLPTPVRIEQIVADRLMYDALSGSNGARALPPLVRDVQIDYTALSFIAPDRIQFRYRLEGFDRDWQEAGNRRRAFYTNLPPRKYRFSVIAANNNGAWNEAGASIDFSIAPAYYQTSWFRALSVGTALALVWAAHRVRLRVVERHEREISALNERLMKAQEQERIRIAGELHDGVMQQMLAVTMMLGSTKRKVADNVDAQASIEKIQQKLIQAGTEIRQLSHGLHPPLLQEEGLPGALRSCCEQFSAASGIPVECEADEHARELSRGAALALFRIAQEALANAAKHASATQITVRLTRANDAVALTVSDDGAGFDRSRLGGSGGLGLVTMRERAGQLGGTFDFESAPGRGTTIRVVIPFR